MACHSLILTWAAAGPAATRSATSTAPKSFHHRVIDSLLPRLHIDPVTILPRIHKTPARGRLHPPSFAGAFPQSLPSVGLTAVAALMAAQSMLNRIGVSSLASIIVRHRGSRV